MESAQHVIKGKQQLKTHKIDLSLFPKLKCLNKLVARACLVNKDICS